MYFLTSMTTQSVFFQELNMRCVFSKLCLCKRNVTGMKCCPHYPTSSWGHLADHKEFKSPNTTQSKCLSTPLFKQTPPSHTKLPLPVQAMPLEGEEARERRWPGGPSNVRGVDAVALLRRKWDCPGQPWENCLLWCSFWSSLTLAHF